MIDIPTTLLETVDLRKCPRLVYHRQVVEEQAGEDAVERGVSIG
jgi:hypothetical protein